MEHSHGEKVVGEDLNLFKRWRSTIYEKLLLFF